MGYPVAGRVVEMKEPGAGLREGNLVPVAGALVVVSWRGVVPSFPHTGSACLGSMLTTSDEAGRFAIPRQFFTPRPYPVFSVSATVAAYRPALELAQRAGGDDPAGQVIVLKRARPSRADRLQALWTLSAHGCDVDKGDPALAPWYRALYDEAKALRPAPRGDDGKLNDIRRRAESASANGSR